MPKEKETTEETETLEVVKDVQSEEPQIEVHIEPVPAVRLLLASVDGEGTFRDAGFVDVEDPERWAEENSMRKDGACWRRPDMIANLG